MIKGALLRPLFLILLACMCITASLELGPNRWVPAVLEAGGIHGILVLAYISGLMAVYVSLPVRSCVDSRRPAFLSRRPSCREWDCTG